MSVTLLEGDCRDLLPTLPAASVQCVVTSPPYWGLRDYGVDGQIGLEATPEAYLATMVGVFREVRRVLRDDGTLWLNMGDSYANTGNERPNMERKSGPVAATDGYGDGRAVRFTPQPKKDIPAGLKPKDLVGMPWRLAFALQADGWYLRADIIWAKPNPMPESVTDRPTKAHEYVFLLSKSARYFYDADAVREPAPHNTNRHMKSGRNFLADPRETRRADLIGCGEPPTSRNLRSVWTIPTVPFPDAHFATFPPALASRCIQAGSSEKGCCAACGAPWAREATHELSRPSTGGTLNTKGPRFNLPRVVTTTTTGWTPTCPCAAPTTPCTVLDPFAGSGTTGQVAEQLGRHSILIELSPAYVEIAQTRTAQRGLFAMP